MSTGRWIEGAVPLVVALLWVALYAFVAIRVRREAADEPLPAGLWLLPYFAVERIVEGVSVALGIWLSRSWFVVTGLSFAAGLVVRRFARRRWPDD